MNIKVLCCAVLALAMVPCGLSFGSIGVDGQFLTNGDVTWVEDNDLETLFSQPINPATGNPYTDFIVREGTRLLAIAEFPDFRNATTGAAPYAMFNTSTEMLTAVQYYEVGTLSETQPGTWLSEFTPVDAQGWSDDLGLTINSDNTFVAVYNDPISAPLDHILNTTVPIGITSASEGTLMYEFGFTYDAAGVLEPGQFAVSATNSTDFLVVAGINGLLTSTLALNETFRDPAATELEKHNFLGIFPEFTDPVYLQATSRKGNEANVNPGIWPLGTDTDGYLKAVIPEPAAVLVWLVLACCGGAFCYRHKRARA